jgi:excisionase family DNA binding protein
VSDTGELLGGIHALGASLMRLVEQNTSTEQPGMLDTGEAARVLGMSADYVRDEIRCGSLIAYRFGRQWRIKRDDLEAFVLRQRVSRSSGGPLGSGAPDVAPRRFR